MTAETRRDEILRMLRILHGISDGLTVMGAASRHCRDEINGIADALAKMRPGSPAPAMGPVHLHIPAQRSLRADG
jgi:hypothetical protein